ncbi:hypothetical protein JCM8208_007850 [Rhodotorula glutinis]
MSPDPRPLDKAPKGSLTENPLEYRSHKLAVKNVLADLQERGIDVLMFRSKRKYRLRVAGRLELVAKRRLSESERIGCFVSQLVGAGLVSISKKPTKIPAKKAAPTAPPSS